MIWLPINSFSPISPSICGALTPLPNSWGDVSIRASSHSPWSMNDCSVSRPPSTKRDCMPRWYSSVINDWGLEPFAWLSTTGSGSAPTQCRTFSPGRSNCHVRCPTRMDWQSARCRCTKACVVGVDKRIADSSALVRVRSM